MKRCHLFLLALFCLSSLRAGDYPGMPPDWRAPMAWPSGPLFADDAMQRVLSGTTASNTLYQNGIDASGLQQGAAVSGIGTVLLSFFKPIVKQAIQNTATNVASRAASNCAQQLLSQPPAAAPSAQTKVPVTSEKEEVKQSCKQEAGTEAIKQGSLETPRNPLERMQEAQRYINNLSLAELSILAQEEERSHPDVNFYRKRYYQALSGTPLVSFQDTPHPFMVTMVNNPNGVTPNLPQTPPSI